MSLEEMARDATVRAAVLASITETEARWLAQNSTLTLRYCVDELMSTVMAERPSAVAAWREAEGIEPPATEARWRTPSTEGFGGTTPNAAP